MDKENYSRASTIAGCLMNMDELAQLPTDERLTYFNESSAQIGLPPQMIEKDFWVCWLLRRVFAIDDLGSHITFKGGTSLSKAYQAIRRFSEDVDLAIEREFLGFHGDNDPEKAASRKQRRRLLEALNDKCRARIIDDVLPKLSRLVSSVLRRTDWNLEMDADDPDRQTILFRFPSTDATGGNPYFLPSIKLEIGARSDHYPVETRPVHSYVHDAFPNLIADPFVNARVLRIDRTYWEKATILHMLALSPTGKFFGVRSSRHYYDLVMLDRYQEDHGVQRDTDLLIRVAQHKSSYYSAAAARYDLAKPGSLRLVPDEYRMAEITRDYKRMLPMFFENPPELDDLMERLQGLENAVNQKV